MKRPTWNYEDDMAFSEAAGISTKFFSVTAPGVTYIKNPGESAEAARSINDYCRQVCDRDPSANGFFATVPSLIHADLAIKEIAYALDHLQADGVNLFTNYAGNYLGHDEFLPIWRELNVRHAVVFVHPGSNETTSKPFNEHLPPPAFDWPHETGRTAMDLILHRRLDQFPNVKIILSHAGGTLPLLLQRATLITYPEFDGHTSVDTLYRQAKRFYFDTALSASAEALPLILGFAEKGHLLYGSDYPYAPNDFIERFNGFLDTHSMEEGRKEDIYHGAASVLFPRLRQSKQER